MAQLHSGAAALEAACASLADPASGATAAAWLNQFRASPAPYEVCRYVLVQHAASSDVAKFQAAGALRDAALREWATLSPDTKRSLVRCLFEAAQLSAGAQVVLGSATAAAAALLKRLWGETGAAERQALIGEVEALAAAAPVAALALMTAIVVEFSPTTASAMGMPWDYHDRCRRDLLDGYVLLFLQRGLQAARATAAAAAADGDGGICLASVRLVTAALSWDFDSSASWASPQGQRPGDGGLAVKPPASWQGALLGEGAWDWLPVGVLTSNHPAGSALREALWQLVVQLCCLDGQVFAAPAGGRHGPGAPRTKHLSTMLAVLLPALSLELSSSVADILLHSSQAVLALARSHRLGGFLAVASAAGSGSALEIVAKLAQRVLLYSVHADADWADDAGDVLLEAFIELLGQPMALSDGVTAYVSAVFDAACERQLAAVTRSADEDEVEYEGDEEAHSEAWLASLAFLGRAAAAAALASLAARLDACQASLSGCMQSAGDVAACLEQLCWVTRLAGFVLADSGEGETPLIPLEVAAACAAAAAAGQPDPAVALAQRLLSLGRACVEAAGHPVISPRLLEEVCCALGRWGETYLLPGAGAGAALVEAFGPAAGGGPAVCNGLVALGVAALTKYPGEAALHRAACERLLGPLTHRASSVLVQCPAWAELCRACAARQPGVVALGAGVQRRLYQCALDAAARAELPPGTALGYVEQLLSPLSCGLVALAAQPAATLQRADCAASAVGLLHSLSGAARAQQSQAVQPAVFGHLEAVCQQPALRLLEAFQRQGDAVAGILQLAIDVVENHAAYLPPARAAQLFAWARAVVQACAAHFVANLAVDRREEQVEFLGGVLALVSSLAAAEAPEGVDVVGPAVFAALEHVVPLVTPPFLAYPRLAAQVYSLLAHVCEAWTEQVARLPPRVLHPALGMISAGMGSKDDAEAAAAVFEAAAALARWHLRAQRTGAPGLAAADGATPLPVLLQALLQRVLLDDAGFECVGYSTDAALLLVLAEPAAFQNAAAAIVPSTGGAQGGGARVQAAFAALAAAAAACHPLERHVHGEFAAAFKAFVGAVRGEVRQR